jgi:hypothetical protein
LTTTYPNKEHRRAAEAAQRRALAAIGQIRDALALIERSVTQGSPDSSEARRVIDFGGDLREYLAQIETLREVREWHAADLGEVQAEFERSGTEGAERTGEGYRRGLSFALSHMGGVTVVPGIPAERTLSETVYDVLASSERPEGMLSTDVLRMTAVLRPDVTQPAIVAILRSLEDRGLARRLIAQGGGVRWSAKPVAGKDFS